MATISFYSKFPDLDSARETIQRNANSLDDIQEWVRNNGWFFAAAHLRSRQQSWSQNRQREYYRAHKDFQFSSFTLVTAGNGRRPLVHFWDADIKFSYPKKQVRDEVDYHPGFQLLGLAGGGGSNFHGDRITGQLGVHVKACDWLFMAKPSILSCFGSTFWSSSGTGVSRWFPDSDLEKLHLAHLAIRDALGSNTPSPVAEIEARFRGEKTISQPTVMPGDLSFE